MFIHEYLILKQGIFFDIEKNILFQCLDAFLLLINGVIYLPRKFPSGFAYYISFVKYQVKRNLIYISSENNYQSNVPKEIPYSIFLLLCLIVFSLLEKKISKKTV